MRRPLTTSPAAPAPGQPLSPEPPQPEPLLQPPAWRETAPIVAALIAILNAVETGPKAGPAAKAYRSAMRRQGEAAAEIGGTEALQAVRQQVAEADPARTEARTAIIDAAWADLMPGSDR